MLRNLIFQILKPFYLKIFPENEDVKGFLTILRGGEFYNIKVETSGNNIEDIFQIKNLTLKANFEKGKIKISELPFDFEDIKGEVSLEKGVLNFKGNALINKNVSLKINALNLDFNKKDPDLFVEGNFYSSAKDFIDILSLLMENPEYFKEYEFNGKLEGAIKLKGEITNIKGEIDLLLNDLLVKTPYYKKEILIEKGNLVYDFNKIFAKKIYLSSKDAYIKDLTGELSLKDLDIDILAKDVWISQEFVEELSKKNEKLKGSHF